LQKKEVKVKVKRRLSDFVGSRLLLVRKITLGLWLCSQFFVFKFTFIPSVIKPQILRLFGASVGRRVLIRRGVRVHFPWNLEIGDDCWIGEEVWFINHEKIKIGTNVCISQRSIICSGGHDYRSASLEYAHKPIEIKDGAWVCLDAKVLPGVTIGECSVVSAGEIARKSVPDYSMLIGGEIRPIDPPK
jgi:putative colanic acid biosynthesis acetyltransferase WcaF